eukprot:CAMPEP_0197246738 /NCGR_PEP_ID=MMETSP1429-20130617/21015_1 /TAXON_ID=49237 /ORGANISM="Chaetoceros  sp., Strain UNC1202" /LENGTH=307 /DNA_ID=CAMNT_0042707473 /DNA_START=17 /DNA_END=940 /DNA_ORIENTATION=-
MKIIQLFALLPSASAFVLPQTSFDSRTLLQATTDEQSSSFSRRDALQTAFVGATASVLTFLPSSPAFADEAEASSSMIKNVVVAGATGQTGSRIYERLNSSKFVTTAGVRNVKKAGKSLTGTLKQLDVVEDSLDTLTETLSGADGLIIACGMNPGKNLLRMSAAAREVDNVGTCKLIDAAKKAGVKKVVLVSSILTNGRAWGQEDSPGFKITNAFGNALDEKLVAEKYLRASGLDYTIVRPGGLQAKAPTGALSINPEDTLNSGEISRDLVADVCVAALNDPKANNKVLEIIENDGTPPKVFNGLNM